jgi:cysteine desulfurase/selenocysteine lyase
LLVVDAAQSIAHVPVDVQDMDIDFMAFSSHKMYGPTGIGVLYGKFDLLQEIVPRNYGGDMNAIFTRDGYIELKDLPSRLEAGTPNIEGVIGLSSVIDYINNIGIDEISKYEHELRDYLIANLRELDFISIYNEDNYSTTVAFNIDGVFSQDTAIYLDKYNICVRAGNHCAKILKDVFNVANTCRISLSFYNTREEVDLLINVLRNSKNIWEEIL